jgi:hypothetical protein
MTAVAWPSARKKPASEEEAVVVVVIVVIGMSCGQISTAVARCHQRSPSEHMSGADRRFKFFDAQKNEGPEEQGARRGLFVVD